MGWLEAVTSIISSVVWPGVVIAAFVIFRGSLGALLQRITSYEGAGQKLTFGAEVEKAEREVVDDLDTPAIFVGESGAVNERATSGCAGLEGSAERVDAGGSIRQFDDSRWDQLARLASISGSAAVIEAWRSVEVALRDLTVRVGVKKWGEPVVSPYLAPSRLIQELREQGVDGLDYVEGAVQSLSRLRNEAAHSKIEISENEALGYADFALSVARRLDQLGR